MGFTKLDSGIVDSSIWSEPLSTRVVWITLLAKSDSSGFVHIARSGLLRASNVPEEEFNRAVDSLESPDKDSRSPEFDGRRIEKVDGGWKILNYLKYRAYTYSDSPEAIKKRRQRGTCPKVSPNHGDSSASASSSASDSDKSNTIKKFVKPTIQEVASYCKERNRGVDPQKWFDHYTSNGWKVGKNPMKDWRAAVRTWEKNQFRRPAAEEDVSIDDDSDCLDSSSQIYDILRKQEQGAAA